MSDSNTILQRGPANVDEALTNDATVKPGHLVEVLLTGKIQKHAKSAGHAEAAFAIEDDNLSYGVGITGRTRDTAYASGDRAKYVRCGKGAVVNARLASGQNVEIGQRLISNGAGCLTAEAHTDSGGEPAAIIAVAKEAINATSAEKFIEVWVY
jgi:hypothetical protein